MQAHIHSAVVTAERDFVCTACGLRRKASVTGIGQGAASDLNSAGTGERRAHEDAVKDVDTTLAMAACPACGVRDPAARRAWWWKNAGLPLAIILPIMAVCAFGPYLFDVNMREEDKRIVVWVMLGITVFVCGIAAIPIGAKWSSAAARVKWL